MNGTEDRAFVIGIIVRVTQAELRHYMGANFTRWVLFAEGCESNISLGLTHLKLFNHQQK
jgi:hypothetical protein